MPNNHDRAILRACQDPAASSWFKSAAMSALNRDPVDAAHDAEELARLFLDRAQQILAEAQMAMPGAAVDVQI